MNLLKHQEQVVATSEQLADKFGVDVKRLVKNFNNNKTKYVEGKHYFLLKGEDLSLYTQNLDVQISSKTRHLYLWTEKGAFNHVKSLGTDEAWDAYQFMVDKYFRMREMAEKIEHTITLPYSLPDAFRLLAEKSVEEQRLTAENIALREHSHAIYEEAKAAVLFSDAITKNSSEILVRDLAKLIAQNGVDIGEVRLYDWLVKNRYLERRKVYKGNEYWPTQKAISLQVFHVQSRTINAGPKPFVSRTVMITGTGQKYFINKILKQYESEGLQIVQKSPIV